MPKRNNYYRSRKPINDLFGDVTNLIGESLSEYIGTPNLPETADRIGETFVSNLLHEMAHQDAQRQAQMLVHPNTFAQLLRMQEDGEI